MKQQLIIFFSKFSYPQKDFANTIIDDIKKTSLNLNLLVDAPCGNGETSFVFQKKLNCKVIAADISKTSIENAKKKDTHNINFKLSDIHGLINELKNVDAFCLINSLFLLPNPSELLLKLTNCLSLNGKLYLITPNITSINYKNFSAQNPHVNGLELAKEEVIMYVEKLGYRFISSQNMAYANIYGRKELKWFSILSPCYLRFLSFIFKNFTKKEPSYILFIFNKKNHNS